MSASFLPSRRFGWIGIAMVSMLLASCAASFCAPEPLYTKDEGIPSDAIVLFDGTDLSKWVQHGTDKPANWKIENGYTTAGGGNIATKQQFQDFQFHVEFWEPLMADMRGQDRGNSGVYMIDDYEVQVLDSYGVNPNPHTCGSLYSLQAPLVNACRPPEEWQSYDVLFYAPRFDANGKKYTNARITVLQNGVWIHNNASIAVVTEDHKRPCRAKGAIRLQDHGCKIRYRNIWIRPLSEVK